jgi:hypothetical protein
VPLHKGGIAKAVIRGVVVAVKRIFDQPQRDAAGDSCVTRVGHSWKTHQRASLSLPRAGHRSGCQVFRKIECRRSSCRGAMDRAAGDNCEGLLNPPPLLKLHERLGDLGQPGLLAVRRLNACS